MTFRHFSANEANGKNFAANTGFRSGDLALLYVVQPGQLKKITQIVYPQLFKDPTLDS
jgi:hypothetical protein